MLLWIKNDKEVWTAVVESATDLSLVKVKFWFVLKSGILGACFYKYSRNVLDEKTDIAGNPFNPFQLV